MNDLGNIKMATLVTAPLWVQFLQEINLIASTVAAVAAAVIGVHTLVKWWKKRG